MKRVSVILAAAALTGCLGIPVSTVVRMATFDPMTMNPVLIRAAVRLPETIDIPVGNARLTISVTLGGTAISETRSFALIEDAAEVSAPGLADQTRPGYRLRVYRLTDTAAAALTSFRQNVAERAKASSGKNAMTLGVAAEGACRAGGRAGDPVLFTTYFATDAGSGFMVLTKEADLAALARQHGEDLPPCPTTAPQPRG